MWLLFSTVWAGDPSQCDPPSAAADADVLVSHATCLALMSSNPRSQLDVLLRALELEPDHVEALSMAGRLAADHGYPEAASLWSALQPLTLTDPGALSARAALAVHFGVFEVARRDLDAYLALVDDPLTRLQRARVALCTGDADTALQDAVIVTANTPRSHFRLQGCWIAAKVQREAGLFAQERTTLAAPACRTDRMASAETIEGLRAELDAQLRETFGPRWEPTCAPGAPR